MASIPPAHALFARGDYVDAKQLITQQIEEHGPDAGSLLNRAVCFYCACPASGPRSLLTHAPLRSALPVPPLRG